MVHINPGIALIKIKINNITHQTRYISFRVVWVKSGKRKVAKETNYWRKIKEENKTMRERKLLMTVKAK